MENLSKAKFWDPLFAQYPEAVGLFCTWIDEYKKTVEWKRLFNSDSNYQDANGKNAPAPKFHDLPLEFQTGILLRFKRDIRDIGKDPNQLAAERLQLEETFTRSFFEKLQAEVIAGKNL